MVAFLKLECLQHKKCQKHSAKDDIQLPPIEVAIDIGSGPEHNRFLILGVGPWCSMSCSFQGICAPETAMNAVKLYLNANIRCAEQANVVPVVFNP